MIFLFELNTREICRSWFSLGRYWYCVGNKFDADSLAFVREKQTEKSRITCRSVEIVVMGEVRTVAMHEGRQPCGALTSAF